METLYEYELGQCVRSLACGLRGTVVGRAEYARSTPTYLIQFRDPWNDDLKKEWVEQDRLCSVPDYGERAS